MLVESRPHIWISVTKNTELNMTIKKASLLLDNLIKYLHYNESEVRSFLIPQKEIKVKEWMINETVIVVGKLRPSKIIKEKEEPVIVVWKGKESDLESLLGKSELWEEIKDSKVFLRLAGRLFLYSETMWAMCFTSDSVFSTSSSSSKSRSRLISAKAMRV